jgi:hypothetical protein
MSVTVTCRLRLASRVWAICVAVDETDGPPAEATSRVEQEGRVHVTLQDLPARGGLVGDRGGLDRVARQAVELCHDLVRGLRRGDDRDRDAVRRR